MLTYLNVPPSIFPEHNILEHNIHYLLVQAFIIFLLIDDFMPFGVEKNLSSASYPYLPKFVLPMVSPLPAFILIPFSSR
jgi:hypothetical protein